MSQVTVSITLSVECDASQELLDHFSQSAEMIFYNMYKDGLIGPDNKEFSVTVDSVTAKSH